MRLFAAAALALLSSAASAAPPADPWHAKAREILQRSVEIPTVPGRGQMPALATYLADQFRAAGWAESDIHIMPHEGAPGDKTASLIVRWPAAGKPAKKPILILAHMDVVEAKREDWTTDPFKFVEKDGYFYGRGTSDNKEG